MINITDNKNFIDEGDVHYDVFLPFGELYKSKESFYVIGSTPIGNNYIVKTEEHKDVDVFFKDDDDEVGELKEYTYTVTKYKSILTTEQVINKFIELIKGTSVIIKDTEFFMKYPIVTTGVAKVLLDNCIAHVEGEGFVNIQDVQGSGCESSPDYSKIKEELGKVVSGCTRVSNNRIKPMPYHKYGSQNMSDYLDRKYPENAKYLLKLNKGDKVINSHTDRRGYPMSCGIENKNKNVTVIIRGEE